MRQSPVVVKPVPAIHKTRKRNYANILKRMSLNLEAQMNESRNVHSNTGRGDPLASRTRIPCTVLALRKKFRRSSVIPESTVDAGFVASIEVSYW